MKRNLRGFAAAGFLLLAMLAAEPASAQKQGGVLKIYFFDSPASVSIHEETPRAARELPRAASAKVIEHDPELAGEEAEMRAAGAVEYPAASIELPAALLAAIE